MSKTKKYIGLLLVYSLSVVTAVGQALIQVPQNAATISAAIQMVQSGDTILLSPGVYNDSVHVINKQIIVKGSPGGSSVLSPGLNERSFVLEHSDVVFLDLTFDDLQCDTQPPNIGVSSYRSDIVIDNCRFIGIHSPVSVFWAKWK